VEEFPVGNPRSLSEYRLFWRLPENAHPAKGGTKSRGMRRIPPKAGPQ
jgi:hypothetical protein